MRVPGIVREFFGHDIQDEYFFLYVYRNNVDMAIYCGFLAMFIVLLTVLDSVVTGRSPMPTHRLIVYLVEAAASLGLALTGLRAKHVREVDEPFHRYLIVYLVIGACYGIYNSCIDAADGTPMLNFVTCMVSCSCMFVMPPVGSCTITMVSYVVFRLLSQTSGIFTPTAIFHYWVSWAVITTASVLRYHQSLSYAAYERGLQLASSTDELTGLKNRWALRSEQSNYLEQSLCVAMCDFDDFKDINDRYGHAVGDEMLYAFGQELLSAFPQASCYRYGGDEFLVVMPCDSQASFLSCARRMRDGITVHNAATNHERVHGSVSIGYAWGTPQDVMSLHSLIGLADSQLYLVKRHGKGGCSGEGIRLAPAV